MSKKIFSIILVGLFAFVLPLTALSEGIPLQKDVLLGSPIFGPEDLPEEITFTLYDSQTATIPLGYQNFTRGQYTVDFEFSKSDGITAGNVARVSADFTKTLNLKDAEGESIQPKELWAGIEVGGAEIGDRTKVSDETLVQLLLASDASIATYLTLAYTGDSNPIATIYKDLPVSSLSSDGSGSWLSDYFRTVTAGASEGVIEPNSTTAPYWEFSSPYLYYSSGNVGIGTSTPKYPLQIGIPTAGNNVVAGGYATFGELRGGACFFGDNVISSLSVVNRMNVANTSSTGYGGRVIKMKSFEGITFHTYGGPVTAGNQFSGVERMRIDNSGKVGIGTATIDYNLAVNGTIGCRELTVTNTGWADFVFKDDYKLPTLREVDDFIQSNKHLPGMPTEAEVREKGVNVAEISTKLLQKVEELTLYMINLKKENDSLKEQLIEIRAQVLTPNN